MVNDTHNLYHPYPNKSAILLWDWYWNEGTQKTQEGFKQLLGIVGNPSFSPSDVSQTPWNAIDKELGQNTFDSELPEWLDGDRGWNCSSVTISVPFHSCSNNPGPKDSTIHDFYHRSLVSIIRETVTNPAHAAFFHYEPYELHWQPPHRDHNVKVHGELFSSTAFLKAHDELQESPPEPGCDLPRIVAALMFWSDSAQLTTFGNAKLWPLYWKIILDDEFIKAYKHGIVITCCDGVKRRFYPHIFTYSADYPEKILIASIRNLDVATERNMLGRQLLLRFDSKARREKVLKARKLMYEENYAVNTPQIEVLLKDESLVATSNAFSDSLFEFGFNLFAMLVVDLLHEFELGVWKAIFTHLLRILDSLKGAKLHELDRRYRQVPSFGRDTIRRFSRNSSDMKRMTAHDFEDLLQCALPVFEGLLPEPHNSSVLRLLFLLCRWHGLAKLWMHTDETLQVMDGVTQALGNAIRAFAADTCPEFATKELKCKAKCRQRRKNRSQSSTTSSSACLNPGHVGRQPKSFNLQTYKLHALGDYVSSIRTYGTTDSYSMQPVNTSCISLSQPLPGLDNTYSASEPTPDRLLFKGNRIYQHHVLRINYTAYDVRRAQDIFNPNSDHRDIMMLATADSAEGHKFCYARIIGVYHANVQYIGPGLKDYLPRRLDFLHVRWFEWIPPHRGEGEVGLDTLRFLLMNDVDAFDFVDPADVLRGCHLIPAFASGKLHPDGIAVSPMARDSEDWKYYYANRFVDRDMLLRYHWGLGIGHIYSHVRDNSRVNSSDDTHPPPVQSRAQKNTPQTHVIVGTLGGSEGDPNTEFSLNDPDALAWEEQSGNEAVSEEEDESDNDLFATYE
ncbi:hypothetical protein HYDPIDRAFT_28047, partial [Hydnomerulius pinastri MD-312]